MRIGRRLASLALLTAVAACQSSSDKPVLGESPKPPGAVERPESAVQVAPTRSEEPPAPKMGNPHCDKPKVKDPSGGPGMVTKATCEAYFAIMETGMVAGKVQCFSERPGESAKGDHPDGRACDISVDDADPVAVEQGERLASWIAKYHKQLRLGDGYVLFNHKSSSSNKDWPSNLSWYDSPEFGCFGATPMPLKEAQKIADASGMKLDKSQKTLCHYDHIHVSILGVAGASNVSYRPPRAAHGYPAVRGR